MKKLKDILYKVTLLEVSGDTHSEISSIHFDSRAIEKDSLFVAVKGTQTDGHEYISMAKERGLR